MHKWNNWVASALKLEILKPKKVNQEQKSFYSLGFDHVTHMDNAIIH